MTNERLDMIREECKKIEKEIEIQGEDFIWNKPSYPYKK